MVLDMGYLGCRHCLGSVRTHHYSSASIAPPTASDSVEEKVQTKGMDMGEVLQKTHE